MRLIDKDKAIELIEKAVDEPAPSHDQQCPWEDGYWCGLYKAESIIENLEVKEVDLNKEIKDYFDNQPIITRSQGIDYQLIPSAEEIAKHFFELGLKAGNLVDNKAQKGE